MGSIGKAYENGWKAIVSPPKIEYSIGDLGLPQFTAGPNIIKRNDLTLTNKRGQTLACSFFENTSSFAALPCIVYLHANGSCRLEALQYKNAVLSQNFHFFCFDFTNCGLSTGTYGSVGYFEQEDIERVVEHLRMSDRITKIGLWGRSMGAVASIMYASKHPGICCIVLDSPFAEFKRLALELVRNKINIPGFLVSAGLSMVRRTVKKKAQFDIYDLKTIEYMKNIKIPALLGAPKDDTFVSPQHTKDLYLAHNGIKQLSIFEGDHNSQRSIEWMMMAINFMKMNLRENNAEREEMIQPTWNVSAEAKNNSNYEVKIPGNQQPGAIYDIKGL